jgi:phosphoglucosamine mutase
VSGSEPRFGTDGIRGVANRGLTAHLALKLGIAAAHVLSRHGVDRHVVVGRDTRLSGDMLEAALNAGLAATGCRVTNVGVMPTPAVSRMVVLAGAAMGVVISASHNPFEDNGIKLLGPNGRKLSDALEGEIEAALDVWETLPRPTGAEIGRIVSSRELVAEYVAHLTASSAVTLDGMSLVLDCANGATWAIAPELFANLGARVDVMHAAPDGANINHGCGSTHPGDLAQRVRRNGADAGLAFDGDGDRVIMVDAGGRVVDGNRMMLVLAEGMRRRGELAHDTVVATVMSNAGFETALEARGMRLVRTDVGDRYVAEAMDAMGAVLGGEQSGHVLMPRYTPTGDGMLTGLRVLAECRATGKPLSVLADGMETLPQVLRNVRLRDREAWKSDATVAAMVSRAKAEVGHPEWVSVRASGTEPLVRVMVQDRDAARVDRLVAGLVQALEEAGE